MLIPQPLIIFTAYSSTVTNFKWSRVPLFPGNYWDRWNWVPLFPSICRDVLSSTFPSNYYAGADGTRFHFSHQFAAMYVEFHVSQQLLCWGRWNWVPLFPSICRDVLSSTFPSNYYAGADGTGFHFPSICRDIWN